MIFGINRCREVTGLFSAMVAVWRFLSPLGTYTASFSLCLKPAYYPTLKLLYTQKQVVSVPIHVTLSQVSLTKKGGMAQALVLAATRSSYYCPRSRRCPDQQASLTPMPAIAIRSALRTG